VKSLPAGDDRRTGNRPRADRPPPVGNRSRADGPAVRSRSDRPAPSAERFLDAFDSFVQSVRRARGASSYERGQALTLSQYGLLQPLADSDGARVRELAEQAGIAPSTATRILDALERRGVVDRRPSSGDRRGVRITLTPAGRELLSGEDEWRRARERDFYAQLPADERRLAPDLLRRLAALIDDLAAGPNGPRANADR
jgi:DNA-binding MarR family transcriptional regulator